ADLFAERLDVLARLASLERRPELLETAFATAEAGTARAFLEALVKARGMAIGGVPAELRAAEERCTQTLQVLDQRISGEASQPPGQHHAAQIEQLTKERQRAEADLERLLRHMEMDYPQYAALKYPRPCTLEQARECLRDNE